MIRIAAVFLTLLVYSPCANASKTTETLQQFVNCIEVAITERHDPYTTAQLLVLFGTTEPTEPDWQLLRRMVSSGDDEATSFALSIPKMDDSTSYGIARRLILSKTKNAQFVRPLGLYPDLLEPDFMWRYQWFTLAALVRNELRMLGSDVFLVQSLNQVTTTIMQTGSVASTTAPLSMRILAAANIVRSNRLLMPIVTGGDRSQSVDVSMYVVSMFPAGYIKDEVEVLQYFHLTPLTDVFSFELAHGKLINSPAVQKMLIDRVPIMSGSIPSGGRYPNLFTYGVRIEDPFLRDGFLTHLRTGLQVRERQLKEWRDVVQGMN